MRKLFKKTVQDFRHLHTYSRQVIHGSLQFTIVLYVFALILSYIAPYTADYFRTIQYQNAALEIAPVTLGAGVISGLLCDLALQKKTDTDDD